MIIGDRFIVDVDSGCIIEVCEGNRGPKEENSKGRNNDVIVALLIIHIVNKQASFPNANAIERFPGSHITLPLTFSTSMFHDT